jgi:hypothetical protein
MLDGLALVAGLALAITASVFAETRWPVAEGSWRWALPGPLLRKLIIVTHPSWDWDQYVFELLLIGAYVSLLYALADWIGPYTVVTAFLLVTAARMGTHAALRSLNVTSDVDASA